MSHDFHNKYPAVGSCRCMDAVDAVRSNIHCALETESHIGSVQVVINGLGQRYDI